MTDPTPTTPGTAAPNAADVDAILMDLDERLSDLFDRLKTEGRQDDAKVVEEAAYAIEALETDLTLLMLAIEREHREVGSQGSVSDHADAGPPSTSIALFATEIPREEIVMTTEPKALLPCPTCGGPAEQFYTNGVACGNLGCSQYTMDRTSPEEWNRRVRALAEHDALDAATAPQVGIGHGTIARRNQSTADEAR